MGQSEIESEKTEVIYCRVNKALKKRLMEDADVKRGEAEAVIVRRALNEYFDRRDHPEKYPPLLEGQFFRINEPLVPSPHPTTTAPEPPQDIAAKALAEQAIEEITGEPCPQKKEAHMSRKVSDIARRSVEKSRHSEKHGK